MSKLLDQGYNLTLRPMQYPQFFEQYRTALMGDWRTQEIEWDVDLQDLNSHRVTEGERHMMKRLLAFWATGDEIVSNNLVLNLYAWINSPEARLFLSRQLFEESVHVDFYLTAIDNLILDQKEREQAFTAIETIPSIKRKGEFFDKWMQVPETWNWDSNSDLEQNQAKFLRNLICFAACVEGMFFFSSFAVVFYMRSRGLFPGLSAGTNWTMADESRHIAFAFSVIETLRNQYPRMFNQSLEADVRAMIREAIAVEYQFAEDMLNVGVAGFPLSGVKTYLEYVADQRLAALGYEREYNVKNPFAFLDMQDIQGFNNFFERRSADYQVGVVGVVSFDEEF